MNVKLFGFSFNLVNLLLALCVVYFIIVVAGCSCSKLSFKEGMSVLGYKMGNNVPVYGGAWDVRSKHVGACGPLSHRSQHQHETYDGRKVPLSDGQLDIFAGNKSDPRCCGSTYTTSGGCLCVPPHQIEWIAARGGNHSKAS